MLDGVFEAELLPASLLFQNRRWAWLEHTQNDVVGYETVLVLPELAL